MFRTGTVKCAAVIFCFLSLIDMRVLNTAYEYVRSESVFGFKLLIIILVYVSYVIISTIFSLPLIVLWTPNTVKRHTMRTYTQTQ